MKNIKEGGDLMIIPHSIPNWLTIQRNAQNFLLDLVFVINPNDGKHSGTFTFKGRTIPFKLEIFPHNLVLSIEYEDDETIEAWENAVEQQYAVKYFARTESGFNYHYEWYYNVHENMVKVEVQRLLTATNLKVLNERVTRKGV